MGRPEIGEGILVSDLGPGIIRRPQHAQHPGLQNFIRTTWIRDNLGDDGQTLLRGFKQLLRIVQQEHRPLHSRIIRVKHHRTTVYPQSSGHFGATTL